MGIVALLEPLRRCAGPNPKIANNAMKLLQNMR